MSTANLPNTTILTQSLTAAGRTGRHGFWARIESWFRRVNVGERSMSGAETDRRSRDDAFGTEASPEAPDVANLPALKTRPTGPGSREMRETRDSRGTFRRPWAKRDSAVENLQNGLGALAELMIGIRDHLEKQSARQDELLKYLSHLPEALRQLPESSRLQGETLKAIHGQMERQNEQQVQVADILERIRRSDGDQGRALDALCGHEAAISENLGRVSEVMQTVGATSEAGARALEQLRDNIHTRDGELERAFKSHNARLTALLSLAIALSVVAVASASAVGYLVMHRMH